MRGVHHSEKNGVDWITESSTSPQDWKKTISDINELECLDSLFSAEYN